LVLWFDNAHLMPIDRAFASSIINGYH